MRLSFAKISALKILQGLLITWAATEFLFGIPMTLIGLATYPFLRHLDGLRLTIWDTPRFMTYDAYIAIMTLIQPFLETKIQTFIALIVLASAVMCFLRGFIWFNLARISGMYGHQNNQNKLKWRLTRVRTISALCYLIGILSYFLWTPLQKPIQIAVENFLPQSFLNAAPEMMERGIRSLFSPNILEYFLPELGGASLIIAMLIATVGLKLARDNDRIAGEKSQLQREVDLTV